MRKSVITLFLLGILLVSPLVLAQEQTQTEEQIKTYSGFNKFTDNVKLTFSGGDNKVRLALEIREKEVNSAMLDSLKNLGEAGIYVTKETAKNLFSIVENMLKKDKGDDSKDKNNDEKDDDAGI